MIVPSVVAVAQLVESRIVIPVVAGSIPVGHPIKYLIRYTINFVIIKLSNSLQIFYCLWVQS